jgi:hypothetical protein
MPSPEAGRRGGERERARRRLQPGGHHRDDHAGDDHAGDRHDDSYIDDFALMMLVVLLSMPLLLLVRRQRVTPTASA